MTKADIIRDENLLKILNKKGISLLMICEIWTVEKLEKIIKNI